MWDRGIGAWWSPYGGTPAGHSRSGATRRVFSFSGVGAQLAPSWANLAWVEFFSRTRCHFRMRVMLVVPWDQQFGGVASVVGNLGKEFEKVGDQLIVVHPGEGQ